MIVWKSGGIESPLIFYPQIYSFLGNAFFYLLKYSFICKFILLFKNEGIYESTPEKSGFLPPVLFSGSGSPDRRGAAHRF